MRVEGAHGNGDAGAQAELIGPLGREVSGYLVGCGIAPAELLANAGQQRVHGGEEIFGRQPAQAGVPHPFVAHGADAAWDGGRIGDAAQGGRHHVAVFQGGGKSDAFIGIVAQPVEQLGEAPLGRVDAAAPVDGLQPALAGQRGDRGSLLPGAVIAPEVVVVERLEAFVDRDHARPGGIEGDGIDRAAVDAGLGDGAARGIPQGAHVIGVALGGVVGVFLLAEERIFGDAGAEAAAGAIEDGNANAEGAEIDAGYDAQWGPPGDILSIMRGGPRRAGHARPLRRGTTAP